MSMDSSNLLNVFREISFDTRPSFLPRSHLRCRRTLSAPWQQEGEDLKGAGAMAMYKSNRQIVVLQDALWAHFLLKIDSWCLFDWRCLSMSFPELITCFLLSCCLLEISHPVLLCLNSSLNPNSAFGLWKRIFWQATILGCPSRYGCLLIRRMAVLEGAFEKLEAWEC